MSLFNGSFNYSRVSRTPSFSFDDDLVMGGDSIDFRDLDFARSRISGMSEDFCVDDAPSLQAREWDPLVSKFYAEQRVAQKKHIEKHPKLKKFYDTMYSRLNAMFVCCFAETHTKTPMKARLLKALESVPYAGTLLNTIGEIIQIRSDQKTLDCIREVIDVCGDTGVSEDISKNTAISLCALYEWQIQTLLEDEDVEKLATYACSEITGHMLDGQLEKDIPFQQQFITFLQQRKIDVGDKARDFGIKQVKKSRLGRKILNVFHVKDKYLNATIDQPWSADDLFSKCGIRTDEGHYYFDDEGFSLVYGFRVGTEEEARQLGMTREKNPLWRWKPSFPRADVLETICNLSCASCCDLVKRNLPSETYDCGVSVRDMRYQFSEGSDEVKTRTRAIFLQLGKGQKATRFFLAFFSGLGLLRQRRCMFKDDINKENLEEELFKTIFSGETDRENINHAYQRATTVILYIAKDLSKIELCLKDSKAILGAFQVGRGTVYVASKVVVIALSIIFDEEFDIL